MTSSCSLGNCLTHHTWPLTKHLFSVSGLLYNFHIMYFSSPFPCNLLWTLDVIARRVSFMVRAPSSGLVSFFISHCSANLVWVQNQVALAYLTTHERTWEARYHADVTALFSWKHICNELFHWLRNCTALRKTRVYTCLKRVCSGTCTF